MDLIQSTFCTLNQIPLDGTLYVVRRINIETKNRTIKTFVDYVIMQYILNTLESKEYAVESAWIECVHYIKDSAQLFSYNISG